MSKPTIRPFDFSRLKKLSRQQVDLLQVFYEKYPQLADIQELAPEILKSFSKDLGLPLSCQWVGIEEVSYDKFLGSLPHPCVVAQVKTEPEEGLLLIELDFTFSRLLVDRLLGGEGPGPQDRLPLSAIEEGIIEYLILKALKKISTAPGILGPVQLSFIRLVQEGKLLADSDQMKQSGCVFKFFLGLGKEGGYLRIFFPHPLVEGLFLREDIMAGVVKPGDEELLEKQLQRASHVKASLWSEIGRVRLQPSEKEALEKGDVILFDESYISKGPHGLSGKAVLRVGENSTEGLLAEVIDAEGKLVVKILDYYGGET